MKLKIAYFLIMFSLTLSAQLKELDKIGFKLDSTLANNNKDYFNEVFDLNSFVKKFKKESNKKEILEFNKGFFEGLEKGFDYGNKILIEINAGASYDFLKSYIDDNNELHILFRLYSEAGLNYHDYLIENINGELKITDVYLYIAGDNLSGLMKNIYYQTLKTSVSGFFDKNNMYSDLFKVKQMKDLNAKGEFQKAYNLYNSLSENSKKEKLYKIVALSSVQNLDEKIYTSFMEEYENEFPNDPSLYLISVDTQILKGNYDKALESINKLDNALNGDDFLDFLRGNIFYLKKDINKATEHFKKLTENYPNFLDGFDSLLTIYIETDNRKKAIEILNVFINNFEFPKPILIESMNENFSDFSKSKEFLNWSKE